MLADLETSVIVMDKTPPFDPCKDHPNLCKGGCSSLTADVSGVCPWCQDKKDKERNYKCDRCDFTCSTINYALTVKICPQCQKGALTLV